MRRVWWRWVTAADEPVEKPAGEPWPGFDPGDDITRQIQDALDEDDPGAVLRWRWPWVPSQVRLGFLIRQRFAGSDAAEDELIERFRQAVLAHWEGRRRWWQRRRKKP